MTIMWQLILPVASELEYYREGDGITKVSPPNDGELYEVTLIGLAPESEYSYRIVSLGFVSHWYSFTTPPVHPPSMRFTFTSDCEDNGILYHRMEANLRKQLQYSPDFFLLGGDLVDRGDADGVRFPEDQWSAFFKSLSILASSRCYWPAVGNHDIDGDYSFSNYKRYHSLPNEEEFYSFRYGSVHFVSLSVRGCAPYSSQYLWLERDLARAAADPTVKFIFIFMHFSGYSSGYYNSRDSMQAFEANAGFPFPDLVRDIYPLFDRYRVSAVFAGHDHHYERTHRIREGAIDPNGIYYFVAGGGGSWSNETKPPQWFSDRIGPQQQFLHFLLVDVEGDTCTIRCIPVDPVWGSTYDSVVVTAQRPVKYDTNRSLKDAVIVYPAPTRDAADLFYYGPETQSVEYKVFDITGRELLGGTFSGIIRAGTTWRLNLRSLSTGVYFCKMKTDAQVLQTRFVKVR